MDNLRNFKSRNDNIFQLSLTEIAFMLIFILILLLGWLYFNEKDKAERRLNELNTINEQLEHFSHAQQIVNKVIYKLNLSSKDPDAIITELQSLLDTKEEVIRLREKLQNQDETLTALTEILDVRKDQDMKQQLQEVIDIRNQLAQALSEHNLDLDLNNPETIKQLVQQSAMVETLLNKIIEDNTQLSEKEKQALMSQILDNIIRNPEQIEKATLVGQNAYLRNRLNASGGRDLPPCWVNENGEIEYLLRVDIQQNGLKVTPIWAEHRNEDAKSIPNIDHLVNKTHSRGQFQRLAAPIGEISKQQACRHYVTIKNHVRDINLFNNSRYTIESVFYKRELR